MQLSSAKAATQIELKALWLELSESPLKAADDNVFQYAKQDEDLIRGALPALQADGGVLMWRLLDNTEVPHTYTEVLSRLDELDLLRSRRGIELNTRYMELKNKDNLLASDLVNWKRQVSADWWE